MYLKLDEIVNKKIIKIEIILQFLPRYSIASEKRYVSYTQLHQGALYRLRSSFELLMTLRILPMPRRTFG